MKLHATEARSRANGPGVRFVIWFQGCTLACPGCYNPNTHAPGTDETAVDALVEQIVATADLEGISISGGEPFQQPEALLALVEQVRARTSLSILVFSGFSRAEIEATELGPAILSHLDVLIDGRYVAGERVGTNLLGSANQHVHLLSERYSAAEIAATPETEIRIDAQGRVYLTGVSPLTRLDR